MLNWVLGKKAFAFRASLAYVFATVVFGFTAPGANANNNELVLDETITGTFQLVTGGDQFTVITKAKNAANDLQYVALGLFDETDEPRECDTDGSTGLAGNAMLKLPNGVLVLELRRAWSCFAFPYVKVAERYRVEMGTERLAGAEGLVEILITGDVRNGTMEASVSGRIAPGYSRNHGNGPPENHNSAASPPIDPRPWW